MVDVASKAVATKVGRRFVTLDALRGVGVATVMAGHAGPLLGGYSLAAEALFMIFVGVLAWGINKLFSPSKKTFIASERVST